MIIASFTTVPFALFSLLFAYVSHHICLVAAASKIWWLTYANKSEKRSNRMVVKLAMIKK